MKIVVDIFGGDNAPVEIVKGAVKSLEKDGFSLVLVGKKEEIENLLSAENYDKSRVEIIDARDIITNNDVPTEALRKKPESSLVKSFEILRNDAEAEGFVSAGSTGAVLTGGVLLLPRIKGINRPALAPILPRSDGGKVMLIDCGANAECKSLNLVQFAQMGTAFMKAVNGVENPVVGLLSNGTEDKKGNDLTKESFGLLKEAEINFKGNIEGRDILLGDCDVVVADGFSGNIALKASEGAALMMFDLIKKGILNGKLRAKIGYLLLKPVFKEIKKVMDYNDNGGAVLLGLKKIVIKAHGSSKAKSIAAAIWQAKQMAESGVVTKIEEALISETVQ